MIDKSPALLLRLEGLALLATVSALYFDLDFGVVAYLLLLIAPDISLAGYVAGPRVGSLVYNIGHSMVLPLGLLTYGVLADHDTALQISLGWLAHIGIDRLIGYGLKYPTARNPFAIAETHSQRV